MPPSFIKLPVLNEDRYKPAQRVGSHDVLRPPTEVSSDQIAIIGLPIMLDGDDKALLLVGIDVESSAADQGADWLVAAQHDTLRYAGVAAVEILLQRDVFTAEAHVLVFAKLTDDLRAEELVGIRSGGTATDRIKAPEIMKIHESMEESAFAKRVALRRTR